MYIVLCANALEAGVTGILKLPDGCYITASKEHFLHITPRQVVNDRYQLCAMPELCTVPLAS